jgi:hypothetical protein
MIWAPTRSLPEDTRHAPGRTPATATPRQTPPERRKIPSNLRLKAHFRGKILPATMKSEKREASCMHED